MPWLSKATKDVISCEKLGGGANIHYIPRYPNGATQYENIILHYVSSGQTRGTETSKYPEEKKTKVIPLVVASERGTAQTNYV